MGEHILEVRELKKYFPVNNGGLLKAVDGVSFYLEEGETLGIVGESGCGKTTCGKTCIGMLNKTSGMVTYKGKDIHKMNRKSFFEFTKEVQMIFQDPYSSLDPQMKVYDIIAEGIQIHHLAKNREEEKKKVYQLLEDVGLHKEYANRYIHEFSGGQRQRIGIARALAVNPRVIFCDEPVSALDVSVQAQIINLLEDLQEQRKLTLLFVAHDLAVVRHISTRIGVMYLGNMVELAESDELIEDALHPYTQALLSAVPEPDPREKKKRERIMLEGDVPSPTKMSKGCRFCERCKDATEICKIRQPEWKEIRKNHFVACHKFE